MDKPKVTPKDFFLWVAAMVALYWSIISFITLLFSYLNYAMPDALSYYSGDPYSSGVSYEMSSLIVLYGLFLIFMRVIRSSIQADPTRAEVWIRRWAIYLTLFVAIAAVAGDLITLLNYFFAGDVTLRFVLKVVIIFLVSGAGFLHFLADLRGYWVKNPSKARLVGWATGILVVISIVAGFFIVGTPMQARLYRFDDQKVNDLQTIQSQVISYYQAKQALPPALDALNDPITNFSVPMDAQTGAAYEYKMTGKLSFELCATFNAATQAYSITGRTMPVSPGYPAKATVDSWDHGAGRVCYDRTVDPQRYPPYPKAQ